MLMLAIKMMKNFKPANNYFNSHTGTSKNTLLADVATQMWQMHLEADLLDLLVPRIAVTLRYYRIIATGWC